MEIPEIKARLPLETVLTHYGLAPDKNQRLLCPFHPDRTPSLQLYPKTNTWCCFSTNCTAGTGDVIDLIRLKENLTEHGAIEKAKELAGGSTASIKGGTKQKEPGILPKLFGYFRNAVANSKPAQEYCASRGLEWGKLEVGYNSGQFHHGSRKDGALIKECLQVGLLLDKGQVNSRTGEKAYSAFGKHCLAFPLKNRQNQITGLYFRSTVNGSDQKHYYLKNRQGLYPCYPQPETRRLILTEAIIDAASLLMCGEVAEGYGILALYGTNGLTAEHLAAIKGLKQLEEAVFFFDGDAAGREAAKKYGRLLREELPDIKVSAVQTPENEDINSLLQSHEPGVLAHLIKERSPFLFSTEETGTESMAAERMAPASGQLITLNPELLLYADGPLEIAVLGGVRLTGLDRLRVTLKITSAANPRLLPVRHSLDLYHAGQTEALVSKLGEQLEVQQAAEIVERLTQALESYRHARMEALKPQKPEAPSMTEKEKAAALAYLKAPQLLERTGEDIGRSGLVGEEVNRLVAYLVYTSRKREAPLQLMCLGASGTGKTYLQEKVGELVPEEEKVEITALSENAFYYFGREELKHKLLLIEDLDGAQDVLYPLRELQSKRRISKTVTLKDSKGNLKTVTLQVEGPVCVSGCTTRERLYEDNANRCLLLDIDTTAEQDIRIMAYQRSVSAGLTDKREEQERKQLLRNVQRLLKPVTVRNPYAPLIDLPGQVFKPRRTITLLLSFIETITFYHQYQCPVRTDPQTGERYIETTAQHVQGAFRLLREILFRKSDELSFATRRFLEQLKDYLKEQGRESFQSREVRQAFRLPPSSVKRYLWELERYGYLKAKGNRYKGLDYQVSDTGEYQQLKDGVEEHLDAILEKISGPVAR